MAVGAGKSAGTRSGVDDPLEEARTYIQHEAGNHFDEARVDAFLANAGPMVEFFEANTEVKFTFGKNYPDYHPDHPGGAEEGRSIHPDAVRWTTSSEPVWPRSRRRCGNPLSWAWA